MNVGRRSYTRGGHRHCVTGSEEGRDHLAFRDFLRRDPAEAAQYVTLERRLAAAHDGLTMESRRYWAYYTWQEIDAIAKRDRNAQERHSLAKTEFIRSVLARALAERQRSDAAQPRGNSSAR